MPRKIFRRSWRMSWGVVRLLQGWKVGPLVRFSGPIHGLGGGGGGSAGTLGPWPSPTDRKLYLLRSKGYQFEQYLCCKACAFEEVCSEAEAFILPFN